MPARRIDLPLACASACLLLLAGAPASADPGGGSSHATQLHGSFGALFETDLSDDADGASFDVLRGSFGAVVDLALGDSLHSVTRVDYQGARYEFEGIADLGGEPFAPWDSTHVVRIAPLAEVEVAADWHLFFGPVFELAFENGAQIDDAVRAGGLLAARHRVGPELDLGLGIVGTSELGDDFYLSPVILLDWTPRGDVGLHLESWTTRGGSADLAWRALDGLELAVRVEHRRERFRLDERNRVEFPDPEVVFPTSQGVGEERAVEVSGRISYLPTWQPLAGWVGDVRVDLVAGAAVAGNITVENESGDELFDSDYDPAPFVHGGLTLLLP